MERGQENVIPNHFNEDTVVLTKTDKQVTFEMPGKISEKKPKRPLQMTRVAISKLGVFWGNRFGDFIYYFAWKRCKNV